MWNMMQKNLKEYIEGVLQLEAVACKDWLTNKVDRSVTGRIARQQCQGELQLPLSDCGVATLDYHGKSGMATSIGHAPQAALISPAKGSVLAIAEALTNISGALLKDGLKSVSLSANWMWPCRVEGEDAALYEAVQAASDFACALGINIPTGKDSLSMTQKYGDQKVYSPGTVIISAAGEVKDIRKVMSPVLRNVASKVLYVNMSRDAFRLGGSAFAQSLNKVGHDAPTVADTQYFVNAFAALQKLNENDLVLAQHDISAGGLVTAALELCFANTKGGIELNLNAFEEQDIIKSLFAENPAVLVQVADDNLDAALAVMREFGVDCRIIGAPQDSRMLTINMNGNKYEYDIDELRDVWYKPSYLLDIKQSGEKHAALRYENYKKQPISI